MNPPNQPFLAPIRPLFGLEVEKPIPDAPSQTAIPGRKGEIKRIVKRLLAIIEDHRQSAIPLHIKLDAADLRAVITSLRDHAKGGTGLPVQGTRDEIHAHVLTRLFEELVEEPSNILFTTITGPETTRYDAMDAAIWLECLDAIEQTIGGCDSLH